MTTHLCPALPARRHLPFYCSSIHLLFLSALPLWTATSHAHCFQKGICISDVCVT
jgi:hypothetical protein